MLVRGEGVVSCQVKSIKYFTFFLNWNFCKYLRTNVVQLVIYFKTYFVASTITSSPDSWLTCTVVCLKINIGVIESRESRDKLNIERDSQRVKVLKVWSGRKKECLFFLILFDNGVQVFVPKVWRKQFVTLI